MGGGGGEGGGTWLWNSKCLVYPISPNTWTDLDSILTIHHTWKTNFPLFPCPLLHNNLGHTWTFMVTPWFRAIFIPSVSFPLFSKLCSVRVTTFPSCPCYQIWNKYQFPMIIVTGNQTKVHRLWQIDSQGDLYAIPTQSLFYKVNHDTYCHWVEQL